MPRWFQSQFNQQRSSRPNRGWAVFATAAPVNVPAASKVLIATTSLSNQGIDETILRTVGVLSIGSDMPGNDEEQIGAFGVMIVTDLAAAAGAASIPGPITDGGDDGWLMYTLFCQSWSSFSAVGADFTTNQYPFDSRAKRVVETGDSLVMMIENAHATHAFDMMVVLRCLAQVRGTR